MDFQDNWIEKDFLAKYFSGKPYNSDAFRQRNMQYWLSNDMSLKVEFNKILEETHKTITAEAVDDFNARFSYLKQVNGIYHAIEKPISGTWTFSRGDPTREVGTICGEHLTNGDGKVIAKYAGSFLSFHTYEAHVLFAGIGNEIICQMPKEFKDSGKSYYFTYNFIEERYETHLVKINLYETY